MFRENSFKITVMGQAGTGNMQQGNEEEKEETASLCDLWDLLSSRWRQPKPVLQVEGH